MGSYAQINNRFSRSGFIIADIGMKVLPHIAVTVFLVCMVPLARTQGLRIAAASDLQFAMNDLAANFEKSSGTKVAVSYGSSGNFRALIANGAPFDLFFSADVQYPDQLVSAGLADADSLYVYAHGKLVLWAPPGENLQLEKRGLAVLKNPRVTRIAIANPEHAPYGRAAVSALQEAGLYGEVKPKLVYGENISQAAQFAQSGNAQIGILALSLTYAGNMKNGERWEVPENLYPTMEQAAVIIHASQNKSSAQAFLNYVKSATGRELLAKYGFTIGTGTQKP
jgi:molybdate transport system substrate-binding protein